MLLFFENNVKWVHSLIISIPTFQLINYNTNTDNENKVNAHSSANTMSTSGNPLDIFEDSSDMKQSGKHCNKIKNF